MQRKRLPTLVTNSVFRLAPWADLLYAADASWWLDPDNADARAFAGIKVCADDSLLWPEVFSLRHTGKAGFDADPTCIRSGCNSGYQAVHVAVQAGASRVLLFGFDMHGGHWDGKPAPAHERFATWIGHFETLAPVLKARGVEVLNCTPDSALGCFERG